MLQHLPDSLPTTQSSSMRTRPSRGAEPVPESPGGTSLNAVTQKAKLQHVKAVDVRLGEFRQTATDAYLVAALTVTGTAGTKPFAEAGTMTYTFHNAGGRWLISTMVWSTKP